MEGGQDGVRDHRHRFIYGSITHLSFSFTISESGFLEALTGNTGPAAALEGKQTHNNTTVSPSDFVLITVGGRKHK